MCSQIDIYIQMILLVFASFCKAQRQPRASRRQPGGSQGPPGGSQGPPRGSPEAAKGRQEAARRPPRASWRPPKQAKRQPEGSQKALQDVSVLKLAFRTHLERLKWQTGKHLAFTVRGLGRAIPQLQGRPGGMRRARGRLQRGCRSLVKGQSL